MRKDTHNVLWKPVSVLLQLYFLQAKKGRAW